MDQGPRSGRYAAAVRVGLTGGVASGKSTVSVMLSELGAVIIDADMLAREAVAVGSEGLELVRAAFGDPVIAADGSMDRAAVAAIVFADPDQRRVLEEIIHPRVRARAAQIEQAAPPEALVVHDIPLLVETGQAPDFDAIIVVDAPVETALGRMISDRGMTAEDAQARIAAQATREQRRAVATYLIENNSTLAHLRARVEEVYDDLIGRAGV